MTFKPEGYSSVSPYLVVEDADGTIQFMVDVFQAQDLRRILNDDGKITHAEVRIDDTVIMLADKASGWPLVPSYVHVYVEDVDTVFSRALAHGAETIQEPMQKDDEDKRAGLRNIGGTTWWIATRVGLS